MVGNRRFGNINAAGAMHERRRHLVLGVIRRRRAMLRMVVRFGGLLRQRRRQQKTQLQRERAESTATPVTPYQVTHLIL